jgi:hypothetical protein
MKATNQVAQVLVLVLLAMTLLHLQPLVMMLVVVFLQLEVLVLVWSVVLMVSHQAAMNLPHRMVQVVVLVAMLEVLNHRMATWVLLIMQVVLLIVAVVMNPIHHNKHSINRFSFYIFLL